MDAVARHPHRTSNELGGAMKGRVLAVDPGEVRTGVAVSDPTRTIARPLRVIRARSRRELAQEITRCAEEEGAAQVIVGVAYGPRGEIGPQARRAMRLVDELQALSDLEILTWDESLSTQDAANQGSKRAPLDARAAAHILQEYLNARG
jgi:putative Holliday junction resolvase